MYPFPTRVGVPEKYLPTRIFISNFRGQPFLQNLFKELDRKNSKNYSHTYKKQKKGFFQPSFQKIKSISDLQCGCKFVCFRACYVLKIGQCFQYPFRFAVNGWLWNGVECGSKGVLIVFARHRLRSALL